MQLHQVCGGIGFFLLSRITANNSVRLYNYAQKMIILWYSSHRWRLRFIEDRETEIKDGSHELLPGVVYIGTDTNVASR